MSHSPTPAEVAWALFIAILLVFNTIAVAGLWWASLDSKEAHTYGMLLWFIANGAGASWLFFGKSSS